MKRTLTRSKRSTSRRRRPPVRPVLECLEARLALSSAGANIPIPVAPPAGNAAVAVQTSPPPAQPFAAASLLVFGGGKTQTVLQFPSSGGGGQADGDVKKVSAETSAEETPDAAVFGGRLGLLDATVVHADAVEAALTQAAEAVVLE